ncbi:MAG: B12-binding domain-containing radical SAM protein [Candidatus Omnitrophica bacterium]|nr:B12-binding domain-containing radical SAM protein [Candidatus Omnitrophota bacterium]
MKVMLLSLPAAELEKNFENLFPLGIGYLVGSLKPSNEVEAYHYQSMRQARGDIYKKIRLFKPEAVGLTCSTFNRGSVREMIGIIKGIDRNIKVIVGGVHASFCYNQILEYYGADVVVIGEGEQKMRELCGVLEKDASLESVKGIAYKENGKVKLTPPRENVGNLDDLAMPDYSYARPYMESSHMGFLITSRGCPVRCTFCSTSSFWGQQVRMNSVPRVVDEMEMLISRYKIKKIFFHDDTFNLGISRVKALCKEIMDRGIKIDWACSCRVTPVSEEMIAAMAEAGCRHICWGIESGSEEILKKINKKITLSQIREAFELSKKFSHVISTGAFAMVGNRGETPGTIQDTVNFLNTIPITDCPSTSILYILPGTLLYEYLRRDGYINDKDWLRYDTVPRYTVENSLWTLYKWSRMVSRSGSKIPFDPHNHFWSGTINETSGIKKAAKRMAMAAALFLGPGRVASVFKAGHIRF